MYKSVHQNKYLPESQMLVNRADEFSLKSFMHEESKTNPLNGLKWVKMLTESCVQHFTFCINRKKPTHHSGLKDCLRFCHRLFCH